MTFPEWLSYIEQSGASTMGVDMNWLQYQYQAQQQPGLIAQAILSGQAPRMMQPMAQPMMQPVYVMPQQQPAKSGASTGANVFMGIFGFVVIIGIILWGISYLAKQSSQTNGPKVSIEGGSGHSTYEQPDPDVLKKKGLDPGVAYPYWPLVYDARNTTAEQDVIIGQIQNYGDKPLKNLHVQFGLYKADKTKVGTADDRIDSLGPGGTWEFHCKVTKNYDKCQIDDITYQP